MKSVTLKVDSEITLKAPDLKSAPRITEIVDKNIAELKKWMPWAHEHKGLPTTRAYVRIAQKKFRQTKSPDFFIFYKGNLVGSIGFHPTDWRNLKASLGYWLDKDCWGKGIITRSVIALTGYAFKEMKVHRLEIRCAPANKRSRAVPERLGFKMEGILREIEKHPTGYLDLCTYSMLAHEWKKSKVRL